MKILWPLKARKWSTLPWKHWNFKVHPGCYCFGRITEHCTVVWNTKSQEISASFANAERITFHCKGRLCSFHLGTNMCKSFHVHSISNFFQHHRSQYYYKEGIHTQWVFITSFAKLCDRIIGMEKNKKNNHIAKPLIYELWAYRLQMKNCVACFLWLLHDFYQFWSTAIKNRNQPDGTDCEWIKYSSYVGTGNFDISHIQGQGLRNISISAFVRSSWPASTPACRPMQLQLKWSLDEFFLLHFIHLCQYTVITHVYSLTSITDELFFEEENYSKIFTRLEF